MPQDLEQVKNLVRQSAILTAVEKAEWLQLLPDMNDQQVGELMKILSPAAPQAQPVPPAPKVDIKQKEISSSIPFYEPEIPAHTGIAAAPKPADPSELQKRVASIVEDLEARRQGKMHPVASEPPPQPMAVQAQKIMHQELQPISLNAPDDFAKVHAAHLHGTDFSSELKKIYDSMVIVGKKTSIYDVVQKFEQSPLYRTYIETGIALLNDSSPDREVAYNNVITEMQNKGSEVLSKDEFEMFADFRKSLEQIL